MSGHLDLDISQIDVAKQLHELDRFAYEESLYKFLANAWKYIDASPFQGGWPIEAMAEHLQAVCDGDIKRLIINVPPRHGKPVSANARINCLEKGLVPLREIAVGDHVLTHRGRFRLVIAVHPQGVIPTLKVRTRTGRQVVAAPDHPFLTPDGWRYLGDIAPDDVLGVVPQYGPSGADTITPEIARLLGYLVGDGHCDGTPNVTVADDEEADDIKFVIESAGFEYTDQSYNLSKKGTKVRRISIRMPSCYNRKWGSNGPVKDFLEKHGLLRRSSYTKLVPEAVMRGSDEIVRNFLGAYWACDGHICTKGAKRDGCARDDLFIGCDSVNEELMLQIQTLLLRLGVSCRIRKKVVKKVTLRQGYEYVSYSLGIADQDNCWRFASRIRIPHAKNKRLSDTRKRRFDFDQTVRGETVESVVPNGNEECVCLTVSEDSSFVANGFAVHNSSLVSVAYPAWTWAQSVNSPTSGPGVQFLSASYANQLALRDSVKSRRLIESEFYQRYWGSRFKLNSDQNTKSRFSNDKGGERLITSVGAAVTGEGGNCFVAGTRVSTPFGDKLIEDIRPGDVVFGFDALLGRVVKRAVVASRRVPAKNLYDLHTAIGVTLRCSGDHPIFNPQKGYTPAASMGRGDRLCFLRAVLSGLRMGGAETSPRKRAQSGQVAHASHRRDSGAQHAEESYSFVRLVPPKSPSIGFTSVAQVERYSGCEDWMYDIQVEGTNNFFAGGILVHNCIIIDDPNSAAEAFSEATIQATIDWWSNAMSTRLNDQKTGAYVIIQQRLAENDLTGYLQEKESDGWNQLILPMRYEPERSFMTSIGWKDPRTTRGELLSPNRFGEEEVASLERALGKFQSAGQLQQRPEPAGGGIIKREWWQTWEDSKFPPMDYILASLDTAYTAKTENDPSAMTVWGVFTTDNTAIAGRTLDKDGRPIYFARSRVETPPKLMLMTAWSEHLEFHDLIKKVELTCRKLKVDKLLVENKAAGISLAQELRRLYGSSNFSVQLSDPKSMDKVARLFSIEHLFEEGVIYAPDRPWADMVITQVGQFPRGKHDDLVDCCSMGIRHLRDVGLLTRAEERMQEIQDMHIYPNGENDPLYPS